MEHRSGSGYGSPFGNEQGATSQGSAGAPSFERQLPNIPQKPAGGGCVNPQSIPAGGKSPLGPVMPTPSPMRLKGG